VTVYVDDFFAAYGRLKMCQLLVGIGEELHAMADAIGVDRRQHQNTISGSHYDIAKSKRVLAIFLGAVPITYRQAAMMTKRRRKTGQLGPPDPYFGPGYDPARPYPGADPR